MSQMLNHALAYASEGWPVFPVRANKQPYTESGVLEATTSKEQIKEWWAKWPNANIAMNVGEAGMMVIDLDPGHSIKELEENIGKLPKTKLIQSTPRGGQHLFYDIYEDEVVPPSASKLADHVDVRSFNSYVLLYPSKTKDGEYEWESQGRANLRSDLMVSKAQEKSKKKSEDHDNWIIEPDIEENINLATDWLKNKAEIAVEGLNGDMMAYKTAAMMKSYGLSPEMAFDLIWEHWNPRCSPPWNADEVEHLLQKVSNGYSYNTSQPGNMTPAYKVAKQQELFKKVSRDTGTSTETQIGRFRFVTRRGIEDIKPPKWIIPEFIPENSVGMLVGAPGSFKTFIALDAALSIASGASEYFGEDEPWYGPWAEVLKPGPVLFAAGEGRASIKQRIKAWEKRHLDGDEIEDHMIVLADPVPHPEETDYQQFVEGALDKNESYRLVVIDTMSRVMQGLNENSQQDASRAIQLAEAIARELDCSVLFLHHSGHDTNRARGSSVFQADVDFEYVVTREPGEMFVNMSNTKQKDAIQWDGNKVIQLATVNLGNEESSLVAVKPSKKQEKQHKSIQSQSRVTKKGRKTPQEKKALIKLIRNVAYETLCEAPGKEYTHTALARGVAAHESITEKEQTIRKTYMQELLTDKTHPISKCWDKAKECWRK